MYFTRWPKKIRSYLNYTNLLDFLQLLISVAVLLKQLLVFSSLLNEQIKSTKIMVISKVKYSIICVWDSLKWQEICANDILLSTCSAMLTRRLTSKCRKLYSCYIKQIICQDVKNKTKRYRNNLFLNSKIAQKGSWYMQTIKVIIISPQSISFNSYVAAS